MTDWYEKWKKESVNYKPSEETSQAVLWLKQMALMSPHFEEVKGGKDIVSESFLNACMQLAYDRGRQNIDQESYDRGWDDARKDVAKSLGFNYED